MIFPKNKIIYIFLAGNKVGVSASYSKHKCVKFYLLKVIFVYLK